MRLITSLIVLAVTLGSRPAFAENWVTVAEGFGGVYVDKDSIRRGNDNLVYFQSRLQFKSDRAADCQNRLLYTIKTMVHRPNWRNEAQAVKPGTIGESELQYVCGRI